MRAERIARAWPLRKTPAAGGGSRQIHFGQCYDFDADRFEELPDCDHLSFDEQLAAAIIPR
jgi:hypothetical protein